MFAFEFCLPVYKTAKFYLNAALSEMCICSTTKGSLKYKRLYPGLFEINEHFANDFSMLGFHPGDTNHIASHQQKGSGAILNVHTPTA